MDYENQYHSSDINIYTTGIPDLRKPFSALRKGRKTRVGQVYFKGPIIIVIITVTIIIIIKSIISCLIFC